MSTFILSLKVLSLLLCNTLITYILAWLFTEKLQPVINRKPFNCRECLAFWLTLTGGIFIALIAVKRSTVLTTDSAKWFARWIVGYASVFLGLLNFLYIKSKFKING